MKFRPLLKKFTAGVTAAALGFSLTFSAPKAEAAVSWGGVVGTVISGAAAYSQINSQIKTFNETEEGRTALYNQYCEEMGVNEDPELNRRLTNIMNNLTAAVGQIDPTIYDKPYKYFVTNKEELNAACSLGHVMFVNTGAFKYLATDDEIAAIVGHEMGHGQKDHVAKGSRKRVNKLVLAQLGVNAAGGGTLANIVGSVAVVNSVAHGDRKNETEADNLAWEYMLNTDYNIGACAAVMQRLAELYGEKSKSNILNPSDHPDTDKRRDNYAKKLYEYSGRHASASKGVVEVNGKTFMAVAETNTMSGPERAYFVLGNLAKAYHNGQNKYDATVYNGTVYLGEQEIVTPSAGDEDAYTLADRLNALK